MQRNFGPKHGYQWREREWVVAAFGEQVSDDPGERCMRLLEETVELMQAMGLREEDAARMVKHVYSRPVGDVRQEIGGVVCCLSALASQQNIDWMEAAEDELASTWLKIEKIRAKQQTEKLHATP